MAPIGDSLAPTARFTRLVPLSLPRTTFHRSAPPHGRCSFDCLPLCATSDKVLPSVLHRRRSYLRRIASASSVEGFQLSDQIDGGGGWNGLFVSFPEGLKGIHALMPGGSWWNLEEFEKVDGKIVGEVREGRETAISLVSALSRMWAMVADDRWIILLGFASLIIAALSNISIPHYLAASIFSAQSGDTYVFYKNTKLLILLCISSGVGSGLRSCLFAIANMLLVKRMRERLYSSLLVQDMSFYDEKTVGELTSRLGADCQQVSRVFGNDLNLIFRNMVQGSGALVYLFILSFPLALCTLVICSLLATVMCIHGKYQQGAAKLTQDFTAYANEAAQETLSLMRTVRVYGTENREFERYMKWLEKLAEISSRQSFAYGFWSLCCSFLYQFTQVLAVLTGGIAIISGHISAEHLTKFLLYSEWLISSTWYMGDNWTSLMQSIGSSEKVFHLMDLFPSNQLVSHGMKLEKFVGNIEFVNLSFHYLSRPKVPALDHINLSIHPDEVVAIVGPSGSGKSTFVNLLLRLYEPTDGRILIDGVPIGELDIKWFRDRIGIVFQEPRLFHTNVISNIRYGCPRKTEWEEVEQVAKQAGVHQFILSLPNGYETLVDDDLLSGGQKQRIAIARALLRNPKILILDEATSALDAESEHYVKEVVLATRRSGLRRTIIVIAHRLSTIQAADRIVVMEDGKIVEIGSHKELLLQRPHGPYARLASRQADSFS